MDKKVELKKVGIYTRYWKRIVYPLAGFFLVFSCAYGYMKYINNKAERKYNKALKLFSESIQHTSNKKIEKALVIFEEVIKGYPLSRFCTLSMPFAGYIYFIKGDYKNAEYYYEMFEKKISRSEYRFLSDLAISSCYESEKKFDKAIKMLKTLTEQHSESPFKEFALLSLERLYRIEDKPAQAKKVIKKFLDECSQSPFFYMAKSHFLSYNKTN